MVIQKGKFRLRLGERTSTVNYIALEITTSPILCVGIRISTVGVIVFTVAIADEISVAKVSSV
jgi:hypothetical protein